MAPKWNTRSPRPPPADPYSWTIPQLCQHVQPLQHDGARAIQTVNQHARSLVPAGQVPTTDAALQQAVDQIKDDHGLRKSFRAAGQKSARIATNYLGLRSPPTLFVYEVEITLPNHTNPQSPTVLKRYDDKMRVMQLIVQHTPQLITPPNGQKHWVTDGDLIWSTVDLFSNTTPAANVQSFSSQNHPSAWQPFSYTNECQERIAVHAINISFQQQINCHQPMGQLVYDPNATGAVAYRNTVPGILFRGLNAMITDWARNQAGTAFRSGNKGFFSGPQHVITLGQGQAGLQWDCLARALRGFFVSARPGIDRLLLNINTACSPFWGQISVDRFIQAAHMNDRQLQGVLIGTKVAIIEPPAGTNAWANPQLSHRFITAIGRPINVSQHQGAQSVLQEVGSRPNGPTLVTTYRLNHTPFQRAIQVSTIRGDTAPILNTWHPASMLSVVEWQAYGTELEGNQTADMITTAQHRPLRNARSILTDGLRMLGLDQAGQVGLGGRFSNMTTGTSFLTVNGHWLASPAVEYLGQANMNTERVRPQGASWDMRRVQFITRATIPALPFFNFSNGYPNQIGNMTDALRRALAKHGLVANTFSQQHGVLVPAPNAPRYTSGRHMLAGTPQQTCNIARLDIQRYNNNIPRYESDVRQILMDLPVPLQNATVLFVLRQKAYDYYAYIKRVAELKLGINTVFMDGTKLSKFNNQGGDQVASNIALKYNLRGGCTNYHLGNNAFQPISTPNGQAPSTIVIGADVAHPSGGATPGTPSIAGVVGSTDRTFMQFPGSMRLQRSRKEYIEELGDMVKERLIDFATINGQLPLRVLFYRDGVSESQYAKVRQYEIPQITKAFNWAREYLNWLQTNPNANAVLDPARNPWPPAMVPANTQGNPNAAQLMAEVEDEEYDDNTTQQRPQFELTYVIVGKRHHTRFYPLRTEDMIGGNNNNNNVQPGLVVDQGITHPYNFDFYLQSHNPIMGTGRSAHYFVLQNGMRLSTEELQNVTHDFCYAYARATKGVSYCAPAYYADRLCDRGRAYLYQFLKRKSDVNNRYQFRAQLPGETAIAYRKHCKHWLRDHDYWREFARTPNAAGQTPKKYGFDRRNPWHERMDGIMFYL